MTFIVLNKQNSFEPSFQVEYNTFEEAENVAKEYLGTHPRVEISVVEVKKKYTAEVKITSKDPQPVLNEDPTPETPVV